MKQQLIDAIRAWHASPGPANAETLERAIDEIDSMRASDAEHRKAQAAIYSALQPASPDRETWPAEIAALRAEVARLTHECHNLNWALGTDGYMQMATPEEQAEADAHPLAQKRSLPGSRPGQIG